MPVQTTFGRRLLVGWADPSTVGMDDAGTAPTPGEGQALLQVERVALTANNVTYALLAEHFGYGRFFPAPDGRQLVPAWGYATCVASASRDLVDGERAWGLWPTAEHVLLDVGAADEDGFSDEAPHRAELPSFYNRYERAPRSATSDEERARAVHRPLFATGWLLARHVEALLESGGRAVVTSASSRTATATAWCLATGDPAGGAPPVRRVGLTSADNVGFTEGLEVWDAVLPYDDAGSLGDDPSPTVLVDLRGDDALRAALHEALDASALAASLVVGRTSWDSEGAEVPPPRPELFFAPSVAAQAAQDRGPAALRDQLDDGLRRYLADDASTVEVEVVDGDALEEAWHRLAAGDLPGGSALVVEW